MYNRVYNFSAGPSMLPVPVLEKARDEMMNYQGCGQSVMEMSHRSTEFDNIIKEAEALLREVMNIPDNYKVIFFQGGASLQFCIAPMNLLKTGKADYITTGQFSTKAYKEGQKYGDMHLAGSSKATNFDRIPRQEELDIRPDADYLHICFNNTIYGTKWDYVPETNIPVVADMSSCILSEPVDVSKFGVIYAGVQKNIAPAGMAIAIVREDLIRDDVPAYVPEVCKYSVMSANDSMYNTPPCWTIYICKLVLEYLKSIGGLEKMKELNIKKAAILYDYLDHETKLFKAHSIPESRSMMNVTFRADDDALNNKFCKEAEKAGFVNIKGHRSVGGMRASIYNAMPIEGVEKLVDFMRKFEAENM